MQQDKTIVLQTFSDLMEAKAMQNRLEEHGITSSLTDENVLGLDPVFGQAGQLEQLAQADHFVADGKVLGFDKTHESILPEFARHRIPRQLPACRRVGPCQLLCE